MKNILLFLFGLFCGAQSFAQDPELFRTWHLYELAVDLGPSIYTSDVQPRINPFLIINSDLSFEGYGACNNFIGEFVYNSANETLEPVSFDATLSLCDYQTHDDFEIDFFGYVSAMTGQYMALSIDPNTNEGELHLEFAPGFYARYGTEVLSLSDQKTGQFKIYPNPVSEQLFISSEKLLIEKINIYSMSGKEVLSVETNEKSIDVSRLQQGLYFLEIITSEGKQVQKFIKE